MNKKNNAILGSSNLFYNTIGSIDSLIIKIVCSLLNININSYDNIKIYRNGILYLGTKLVISFSDNIFVDIRLNINNRDYSVYEGINSFLNIYNNTVNLNYKKYKYFMLNFDYYSDVVVYDSLFFSSNFCDYFYDKFNIVFYNYKMYSKPYNGDNNLEYYNLLSLLNVNTYYELLNVINNCFFHKYERKLLIYLVNYYWVN